MSLCFNFSYTGLTVILDSYHDIFMVPGLVHFFSWKGTVFRTTALLTLTSLQGCVLVFFSKVRYCTKTHLQRREELASTRTHARSFFFIAGTMADKVIDCDPD